MKPRTGYLYKVWKHRYVKQGSKLWDELDTNIRVAWEVNGRVFQKVLPTHDPEEARSLADQLVGGVAHTVLPDKLRYIASLEATVAALKREVSAAAADAVVPVDLAWERYVASRRRPQSGPATMRAYKGQWTAFRTWLPARECRHLQSVTPGMGEKYLWHLETEKINAGTIGKHIGFLRLFFRVLAPEHPNPFMGLTTALPKVTRHSRRLTTEEVRSVVGQAAGEWRLLLIGGYCTGMRLGDVARLDWRQVDLAAGVVTVVPQKTARSKPTPIAIPILPDLDAELQAVPKAQRRGPVMPAISDMHHKDAPKVSKRLADIFEAAKVKDTAAGTASFKSLRATFVTLADEAGVPRPVTQAIVGHATAVTDQYSHPSMDVARREALRAIPRLAEPEKKAKRRPSAKPAKPAKPR